jgi:hypothetical protein
MWLGRVIERRLNLMGVLLMGCQKRKNIEQKGL